MKKVTTKLKQALSILLAAAMVITMVPQNALSVSAQEEAVETVFQAEDTALETNEETTDGTVLDGAEVSEETGDEYVTEDTDTAEIEDGDADAPDEEDASENEDAEVYGEDDAVVMSASGITIDSSHDNLEVKFASTSDEGSNWNLEDSITYAGSGKVYVAVRANKAGYEIDKVQIKINSGDATNINVSEDYSGKVNSTNEYELYEIPENTITGTEADIVVYASAKPAEYTVTAASTVENLTIQKATYDVSGSAWSVGEFNANYTVESADVIFAVKASTGYTLTEGSVKYKVGTDGAETAALKYTTNTKEAGSNIVTISDEGYELYTLATGTITDNVTLSATATKDEEEPEAAKTVTWKIQEYDSTAVTTISDKTTDDLTAGTDYTFTAAPAEGYTNLTVEAYLAKDYNNGAPVTANKLTVNAGASNAYTVVGKKDNANVFTDDVYVVITAEPATYKLDFGTSGANITNAKVYPSSDGSYDNVMSNYTPTLTNGTDTSYQFKVTAEVGNKVRYVGFDSSDANADGYDAASDIYTIPIADIKAKAAELKTATVPVYVKATALESYNVTFTQNGENTFSDIEIYTVTDTQGQIYKTIGNSDIASDGSTATEGEDFSFYVKTKNKFTKIDSVTPAGGEALSAATVSGRASGDAGDKDYSPVYTVEDVSAAVAIDITTILDETAVNTVSFTSTVNDGSAKPEDVLSIYSAVDQSDEQAGEGTFMTREASLVLNFVVADGYKIAEAKLGTKSEEKQTVQIEDNKLTVSGLGDLTSDESSNARVQKELEVTLEEIKLEDDITVSFQNTDTANLTLNVTTETGKVTKKSGSTYVITPDAGSLDFTVTAPVNFEAPTVAIEENYYEAAKKSEPSKGKITYTYSIKPVSTIPDGANIVIAAEAKAAAVVINYNADEVNVSASSDGQAVTLTTAPDADTVTTNATIEGASVGTKYVLTITPKDNCDVKGVTVGETAQKNVKAAGGDFTITAEDGLKVAVTSTTNYSYALKQGSTEQTAAKGVYTIVSNLEYTATAVKGTKPVTLSKVVVKDKNKKEVAAETVTTALTGDGAAATINVKDRSAATYTVELYTADTGDAITSFKISVLAAATEVTIKEAKDGAVEQLVDQVTDYTLQVKPNKASLSNLKVEVTAAGVSPDGSAVSAAQAAVTADIVDGKLQITTKPQKGEIAVKSAVVKITDATAAPAADPLATLIVNIATPELGTPTLTQQDVDSQYLSVNLTLNSKITTPETGKLWYKVSAVRKDVTSDKAHVYYYKKTDAASQTVKIDLKDIYDNLTSNQKNEVAAGVYATYGEYYSATENYDVTATLVQTIDAETLTTLNETDKKAFEGKESDPAEMETKTPSYETNLKLKKGTTTITAGQSNVKIATPQFSEKTTYKTISAGNVTVTTAKGESATGFTADISAEGDILMSVEKTVDPGKYNVTVKASAPGQTKESSAALAITVVKGINYIEVSAPATLYKEAGKAATLKLSPVLNYGTKADQPKSKKVKYEILTVGNASITGTNLDGKVTVKDNGTVTVDKSFTLSATESENQFKVKVTAADYDGNTTNDVTGVITITNKALTLSQLYIVETDDESGNYKVVARADSQVSPAALSDTQVIAIVQGGPELQAGGTIESSSEYIAPVETLSFKSGNKAVEIKEDGTVSTIPANWKAGKVKITATANDGGKSKAELNFSLITADTSATEYGLQVRDDNTYDEYSNEETYGKAETPVTFKGANSTTLDLHVMARDTEDEGWSNLYSDLYNVSVNIKNAKILSKDAVHGDYTILPNAKSVTVTLTYTKTGTKTKTSKVYTITNESFVDAKTTPKLKATGTLYANYLAEAQTISYQLQDQTFDYTTGNPQVQIDVEPSVWNTKQADNYWDLLVSLNNNDECGTVYRQRVEKDGSFDLTFSENYTFPAGTYKLLFTFGTYDKDGTFIPSTKSQSVSLKAVAYTKMNYKPQTAVKLSASDKASVKLAGTGKNIDIETYSNLRDANTTGAGNGFTKYFTLDAGNNLSLNAANFAEFQALGDKEKKAACTGYVDYVAVSADGVSRAEGTTKLTVTVVDDTKQVDKYSAPAVSIIAETETAKQTATVSILKNKEAASLVAAVAKPSGKDASTPFAVQKAGVSGDQVTLTYTSVEAKKSYNVDLYVVPASSFYANQVKDLKDAAEAGDAQADAQTKYEEAVLKYGFAVKATIKTLAKADAKGKISVAKSDQAQTFTSADYDATTGDYIVNVPYTVVMPCKITGVTLKSNKDADKEVVSFTYNEDEQTIAVHLNKAKFDANQTTSSFKYETKNLSVTATVAFEGSVAEDVKLSLTLPAKVEAGDYATALANVKAATATIQNAVTMDYWKDIDNDNLRVAQENAIKAVYDEIVKIAKPESGAVVKMTQLDTNNELAEVISAGESYTAPTTVTDGLLKVTATIQNGADNGAVAEAIGPYTITIAATGAEPSDVDSALDTFISGFDQTALTNDSTFDDIRDAAYEAVLQGKTVYSTLRLYVEADSSDEEYYGKKDATVKEAGYIKGKIVVWGTRQGEQIEKDFEFTIPKLDGLDETADLIWKEADSSGALNKLTFTNSDIKDETAITATQQKIYDKANAAIKNKDITLSWKQEGVEEPKTDVFKTEAADRTKSGSITGTLVLTLDSATKDVSFTYTIAQLLYDEAGVTKAIKDAVGIDGSSDGTAATLDPLLVSNTYEGVEAAILRAANDAVSESGFTVTFKEDTDTVTTTHAKQQKLEFKAATWEETGSVEFTLAVTDSTGGGVTVSDISMNEYTIAKTTQTLKEAADAVKKALGTNGTEIVKKLTEHASYAYTTTEIKTATNEAISAASAIANASITSEVTAEITTAQSFSAAGEAKVTVKLTDNTPAAEGDEGVTEDEDTSSNTTTVVVEGIELAKLVQATVAEAKAAVEKWYSEEAKAVTVTNADDDAKEAKQTAILELVKGVVDTTKFDVTASVGLAIKKSTKTKAGEATMTVNIHLLSAQDVSGDDTVAMTFTIAKLAQDFDTAQTDVKAAVEGLTITNSSAGDNLETTKAAILKAASDVLDAEQWQAVLSETEGETFEIKAEADVNNAGSATVTVIVKDANTVVGGTHSEGVKVACTITIAALDQKLSEATTAVTNALKDAYTSAVAATPTQGEVEAVINSAIKQSLFSFEWTDDFSTTATTNTITGTIKISYKNPSAKPDGHSGEQDDATLTISQAYTVATE
jgi:hypothetical protein